MTSRADPQHPPAPDSRGFIRAMGLFPATTLNMAQMVGIGPFITIPLIISGWAAIRIMLIWTAAGIVAFLVWARLEHSWPFGPKQISEEFLGRAGPEPSAAAVEVDRPSRT